MAESDERGKSEREQLVEAVVLLQPKRDGSTPLPEESRAMMQRALSAAAEATSLSPAASAVFDSLHSFSVRAPKAFVDALSRLPEVAQVLPNEPGASPVIEPVQKRPIKLPE